MSNLYHYTCSCVSAKIGETGVLIPHANPMFPEMPALIWLTDQAKPDRDALGLTSYMLTCNRTRYRYVTVGAHRAIPWTIFREAFEDETRRARAILESTPGAKPSLWWVAVRPVEVIRG